MPDPLLTEDGPYCVVCGGTGQVIRENDQGYNEFDPCPRGCPLVV